MCVFFKSRFGVICEEIVVGGDYVNGIVEVIWYSQVVVGNFLEEFVFFVGWCVLVSGWLSVQYYI